MVVEKCKWVLAIWETKSLWLGEGLDMDVEGEGDVKIAPGFLVWILGYLLWNVPKKVGSGSHCSIFFFFQIATDETRKKCYQYIWGGCGKICIFLKGSCLWMVRLLNFGLQRSWEPSVPFRLNAMSICLSGLTDLWQYPEAETLATWM